VFFFSFFLSHNFAIKPKRETEANSVKSNPIEGVSDVNDLRPSFHRYLCISTDAGCPRRLRFTKSTRLACEIGDNFHQISEEMAIQPVSAARVLTSLIVMGSGIIARACTQAYRQALASLSFNYNVLVLFLGKNESIKESFFFFVFVKYESVSYFAKLYVDKHCLEWLQMKQRIILRES
ncbi:unnamed protein product, partial [Arabidopsis halleri]